MQPYEEIHEATDLVGKIVEDARASWVGHMTTFTELPRAVFEEAFEVILKLGEAKGRCAASQIFVLEQQLRREADRV